ncbi:MAG: ribulose-phosphate 3-epimerase [Paludibacter sp.]|nr:ribulose-phosphate 3-epimerase [Bacteroidales bacterium]MCM1068449.1 ribulose-phosphate 3-epimerase [Prevotella sp.]MCM1353403.1 ribulose-phosphate 3-epimerase [Bacteroides sp.]MCM1442564.1 ribulose-phosphate 3-epimerase [Muribaculum sp.]MCM1481409.1 ribulose-phosphate 3-epimerase [Paludibacter sp.]
MKTDKLISPSLLSADFSSLGSEIEMINRSAADWFHIDVMDGVFVPNISFGFPIMEVLKKYARKPLDVHLMITHPEKYVERFADAGAWSIGFHLEAVDDPRPILNQIRAKGCRTCLTINPDIEVERLQPYLAEVDMILLMSVFAGYGGQKFIDTTWERLRKLKSMLTKAGLSTLIEIDGGVNKQNAPLLFEAGADVLVAGSSVFKAADPENAVLELKGLA